MRCLTIHQPWAELIARGWKQVENRTWITLYRGPLAIHAGLTHKNVAAIAGNGLEYPDCPEVEVVERDFGRIIAVVDVVECVEFVESMQHHVPWATGPYCWMLENVQRLAQPIPISGRQGLWNLPPKVAAAVKRQLL